MLRDPSAAGKRTLHLEINKEARKAKMVKTRSRVRPRKRWSDQIRDDLDIPLLTIRDKGSIKMKGMHHKGMARTRVEDTSRGYE